MRTATRTALWGGAAVLLASVGFGAAQGLTANAATTSKGVASSSGNGADGGNNGSGVGNGGGSGSQGRSVTLTGAGGGRLAPGVADVITVTVTNPNASDVLVTRIEGRMTAVTTKDPRLQGTCLPEWFILVPYVGDARITRRSTGDVPMDIKFTNTSQNQDSCKGATYTFALTATVRQAP